MTEEDIAHLFSSYGNIKSIKVKMPLAAPTEEVQILTQNNLSALHGIAYIDFDSEESANRAKNDFNGKKIGNQTLSVKYYEKQIIVAPP